jgi:hypothetical protein
MDFYLNLLNDRERAPDDHPSIDIILCAEKDEVEVEFALKTKTNPIGVAEYQLQAKLLPRIQRQAADREAAHGCSEGNPADLNLGQHRVAQAVNFGIVKTYWEIGRHIVEFEQKGRFSRSNLNRIRRFFLACPICAKPSHKLSWSHYVELLKMENPLERSFYERQATLEKMVGSGTPAPEKDIALPPFCRREKQGANPAARQTGKYHGNAVRYFAKPLCF